MDKKDVLIAFLQAWKNQDYEQMYQFSQLTWKEGKTEENIEALFSTAKVKDFNIFSSTYVSSAAQKYAVDLTLESGDRLMCGAVMVICEAAPNKTAAWGEWGVNPASVLNISQKIPAKKPATKKPAGVKKAKDNARKE